MECYCDYDYDPPEFLREKHHIARMPHNCSECGRQITLGERYLKVVGKWDGRIENFRRCSHCDAVANALKDRLPCFCDSYRGLWEELGDGDYIRDLMDAKTGDAFAVLRLVAQAKRARLKNRDAATRPQA